MRERMKELVTKLRKADTAYYKYDSPTMSDRDYDKLYDELAALEEKSGVILSGSPTQKVSGGVLDGLAQVRHSKPMLSAAKTKSMDDIVKFIGSKAAVVSWKLDGLTLVLRYEGGRLVRALTRGGGMTGEDVTHTVRTMTNVPLTVSYAEPFEVRGEGVISWENFEKINRDSEESYAHPRNLAAGAIRRLDAGKTKEQFLEFFAFELIGGSQDTKAGQLRWLDSQGFDTVYNLDIHELSGAKTIEAMLNVFRPKEYGYPVDGLIIEYDNLAYGRSLGVTGHHENRLIALKWEDELFETVFLGLELATTRTGMVSLTGIFKDVIIDGTTVNRAYLHNLNTLDNLALGPGDTVKIYKANMIIPQVAENLTRSGTTEYPKTCPCCGSKLTIRASDSGTRLLFCEDPSCPAKLVRKFVHFCDKTRMDMEGLSEKTLTRLIEAGFIKNFGDLYELRQHAEEVARLPGFGPTLIQRLLDMIEFGRRRTLAQFIAGLGIPMVGRSAGRILDTHFKGDWDAFEQAVLTGFDFTRLQDFGRTMHDNIHTWYADAEEAKLWRPLLKHIIFIKEKETDPMNTNNPFSGKTVVATGKLENYTRDGIQTKLLSLGAKPAGSISKSTDYLIVGENAGSKLEKARTLGVPTLTEVEFEAMLTDTGANT